MKLFVLFALFAVAALAQTLYPLQINTPAGVVHGFYEGDFVIYRFPYARLTNESTKFMEPAWPTSGVWNITTELPSCLQNPFVSFPAFAPLNPRYTTTLPTPQLACEYMEIKTYKYMPVGNGKRQIEIHIHSGAYSSGHGTMALWKRDLYILEKNIIWVGFQHQLHAFGFINLPGLARDIALKQILMAIQTAKVITPQLRGDNNDMTARTQSGGAAKIIQLMADNLLGTTLKEAGIKKVILGSPAPVISIPENNLATLSAGLANLVGCFNPATYGSCLASADSSLILTQILTYGIASRFLPSHGPNSNFANRTTVLYDQGKIETSIRVMIGNNDNEGEGFLDLIAGIREPSPTIPTDASTNESIANIEFLIGAPAVESDRSDVTAALYAGFVSLSFSDYLTATEINNIIGYYFQYTFSEKKWYVATRAAAEGNFECQVDFLARAMVRAGNKVFRFIFTHTPDNAVYPNLGAGHGVDHPFFWMDKSAGYPQVLTNFSTREVDFVNKIDEFFYNFQQHKDPTHGQPNSNKWKEYNLQTLDTLRMQPFESPISDYVMQYNPPASCSQLFDGIYRTDSI